MNKILHIILISLFSLTVFSCAKEEEKKTEAPVIAEVYPVTTPTSDPHQIILFHQPKQELSPMGVHLHTAVDSSGRINRLE